MRKFTKRKFVSWKLLKKRPTLPPLCPMDGIPISPSIGSNLSPQKEAEVLLKQIYTDQFERQILERKLKNLRELNQDDKYIPSIQEMESASRIAWRNATRCIGRLLWSGLLVRDKRSCFKAEEIFKEIKEHLDIATNQGNIRSVITVFPPISKDPDLIISPQLIRYAGYRYNDKEIIGDPENLKLTKLALDNGWAPPKNEFDLLPVIIRTSSGAHQLYKHPDDSVLEIKILHPSIEGFNDLKLKWYAVPAISNMFLDAFGDLYPVIFNGWYMGTEIGSRNLSDPYRYDKLPKIGNLMGLDISDETTMWRDRALVELNYAVVSSFKKANVSIIDHHNASREFLEFIANEHAAGRDINANWSWTVPPVSGSLTPQFHLNFQDKELKPAFVHSNLNKIIT